ncbi:MAG: HAD-IIIA family hydrolase [Chloroflexi bacterium]|nr:HAD-IIIA family hydrolase [Chloroflexota bacterium]
MKYSETKGRMGAGKHVTPLIDSKLQLVQAASSTNGLAQPRRAIFLDRDGVINALRPDHVTAWNAFQFLPGALAAIRQLSLLDLPIVVATNQSAVGRGLLSADGLADIHRRMVAQVELAGGRIDLVVHCPHTPEDECLCRKPELGLFQDAAERLNVNLTESYFVGDTPSDLGAARQLGMTFVLVRSGLGATSLAQQPVLAGQVDWLADTIAEASQWILEHENAVVETRPERQAA